MKVSLFATLSLLCGAICVSAQTLPFDGSRLTGTVIGTEVSVDYATGAASTTVNARNNAFDGNLNTFFASYDRSFTWVGLDLGQPYVLTGVGYCARNDASVGESRMCLGVFQGANNPDFSDALPLYVIPSNGVIGKMLYAAVDCSKGFRYVRYVGPRNARCNVAELEFYGAPGQGDDSHLYQVTNLPTVVVNTPNMEWFHEDDKEYAMEGSTITIIADGKVDVSAPGQIRGRGNASWTFPKKPFRIKFDKKQTVLGGPANAKKWTMINNYGDKTLMRNRLAFDISQMLGMAYTPACHFVDLVFNGEYEGTYQLCDQVEVNKNRVNIKEMKATDVAEPALTGGYLIEIDAYASSEPADEWFTSTGGHRIPVTIKSPDPGVNEQYQYIKKQFSNLERAIFYSNFANETTGYRTLLDLDSFLQHFIVGELSGNTDTYWSVYMSLDREAQRFVTGPVWDFDLAFENDQRTYPINQKSDFICFANGSFANGMREVVQRIIKSDDGAKSRLSYLWSDARKNRGLSTENFNEIISRYAAQLQASQDLNFKRWPILNQRVHQNPRTYGSYDGEVQNVRSYLERRFEVLDKLIGIVEVPGGVDDVITDNNSPIYIYNMQGICVAAALSQMPDNLPHGIYIVKQGDKALKIKL